MDYHDHIVAGYQRHCPNCLSSDLKAYSGFPLSKWSKVVTNRNLLTCNSCERSYDIYDFPYLNSGEVRDRKISKVIK